MFVVSLIVLVAVLAAASVASRRRSQSRGRPSADDVAAAERVRSEINAAQIDAAREKGKQWY